jgi:hypothetical protein
VYDKCAQVSIIRNTLLRVPIKRNSFAGFFFLFCCCCCKLFSIAIARMQVQSMLLLRGEGAETSARRPNVVCSVPGCPANEMLDVEITRSHMFYVHRLTRNEEMMTVQRQRLAHRIIGKEWPNANKLYICSLHFEDGCKCFINYYKNI